MGPRRQRHRQDGKNHGCAREIHSDQTPAAHSPFVCPASQHCALIHSGTGLSTYAPECTLRIERRTLPGEEPEGAWRRSGPVYDAVAVDTHGGKITLQINKDRQ